MLGRELAGVEGMSVQSTALAEAAAQPGALPALERLYLNNNQGADAGLAAIAEAAAQPGALPALRVLYLDNTQITDAGAGALARSLFHNQAAPAPSGTSPHALTHRSSAAVYARFETPSMAMARTPAVWPPHPQPASRTQSHRPPCRRPVLTSTAW